MASRKRRTFVPSKSKVKQVEFEVKVVGGINEALPSPRKPKPQDLREFSPKFREFYNVEAESSKIEQDQHKQYVKYKLNVLNPRDVSSKPSAFEKIRQTWFDKICDVGAPFWLESCEKTQDSYRLKANAPKHSFQPSSCSLGSFFDRGTFIEHYSTADDAQLIQDGVIYVEFQHDAKVMEISFNQMFGQEFKLEYQYKQFEEYVLVDEKTKGVVDIYIPLLRPPKVARIEEAANDRTNEIRCVSFLNCSREVLGKSCVLKLCIDSSENPLELITRLAKMSRTVYFGAVATRKPAPQSPTKSYLFDDFNTAYALECLLSRGFKVTDRLTSKFYGTLMSAEQSKYTGAPELPSTQICRALYQLIAFVDANRFCPLEVILKQLLFGKFKKNVATDLEIPKHYVYIPRIIITPTQDYLVQPELVAANRVIRQYGHEFAMRIAFREEDFSKLSSFSDSLKDVLNDRVVRVLREGVSLCGRRFNFLACSNSQLRDHGAWLYAHDGKRGAEEIRQSLGELENIRCVATFVSRMGQCFSSTKESVTISIAEGMKTQQIPDITKDYKDVYFKCCQKFRSGTYTFSDGVGQISHALAKKIAESLDLKSIPSAFQIRYAGCKGMLAINASLSKGKQILYYRNSMRKFDSEHQGLEICDHSKSNLLYLNRQCITLLSGLGVPDENFIRLQDTMLMRLASMLLFESVAIETLSQASVAGGLKAKVLHNSGIMVTCEPFFRSLLLAVYKSKLNDLLRKARIAIPGTHGRLLIGVLDETDTLEYGQVFIRYTKDITEPNKEYVTLTGQVVVTKNPCFHPGDMRKFQAIDVKCLYHLVDCIVFPAQGPRPHTDEISGSDLDGDKYFATWYKQLIPPGENEQPMDFPSPEKRVLSRPVNVNDMIEFVAEYIKNDQLGVIANSHLVHADSEAEGVKSEKCIRLAHMHSDAVDFPKTGHCPSLPQELRPEQYPDFMMKPDKPRYKSTKVLGKLFQKCNQLERARYFMNEESPKELNVDEDLILEGHEEFLEAAIEKRDRYNTKLGSLMALYGLKDEGEVLTGCLTKVGSRLSGKTDEKFEVAQLIQASVASLRNNLKKEFFEEFGGEEEVKEYYTSHKKYPEDVLLKASAWYVVTYNKLKSPSTEDVAESSEDNSQVRDEWSLSNSTLLSFPWIVSPILANIKAQAREDGHPSSSKNQTQELEDISKLIVSQTKMMFFNENIHLLNEDFQLRRDERDELGISPLMSLLGASLTGLNIGDKKLHPLQLFVRIGWDADSGRQWNYLLQYEQALKRSRKVKEVSLHQDRDGCPCISFKIQDFKCSISADPHKGLKSFYIYLHIKQYPLLLPLLLVIMHWARKRYMIGSARDRFMEVEDLGVLFIRFCEHKKFIKEISLQDLKRQADMVLSSDKSIRASEVEWRTTILSGLTDYTSKGFLAEPGLALIKFWEFYGGDSESDPLHLSQVRSPVSPRDKLFPQLDQEYQQRFTDAALHTFHEIAQRRGLDSLLKSLEIESLKEVQETLVMPNCTWGSLRFAEDFVAHGLSNLTNAKVNIRPAAKGGGYLMEVVGNYITLSKCQAECHRLESKTRNTYVYDHIINGGNRLIFLNQSSGNDTVTAKRLPKGDFVVNISIHSGEGLDERKLIVAVEEQLQVFNNCYMSYLHGSKNLHISLEYGSIYLTNAHAWVLGTTVDVVEQTLKQTGSARRRRGDNNTGMKFIPSQPIPISSVTSKFSSLGSQKEQVYVVEIKASRNHNLKVILDDQLQFKRYQFEPFKWLDVKFKSRRVAGSKTRDIDLRIVMESKRELETTEDYQNLPVFETFGQAQILSRVNGQLEIAKQYRRRVAFVYCVDVEIYNIIHKGSNIFLEFKRIKKFNAKRPLSGKPEKEYESLKLYGETNEDVMDAKDLARNILEVGRSVL